MDFFSIHHLLVHIPLGTGGYDLSWIEAIGTLAGLICIWLASKEKTSNYLFGLINVTLFALIFFQIQLYASLLLQVFFFLANLYGWYVWRRPQSESDNELVVRWLTVPKAISWALVCALAIGLLTLYIDPVFAALSSLAVYGLNLLGMSLPMPHLQPDAFPFWDASMTVLSVVAMLLMTRKYVENWILWVVIDVISIGVYAVQGVWAMAIEYLILTFIAANGCRLWMQKAGAIGSRP